MSDLSNVAPKRPGTPRVVHLTTTDVSLDWLLASQLRAFIEAGYEVVGMSAAGPHVPSLRAMGVAHVDVPSFTRSNRPTEDLRAFVQVVRLLRQLRPDILHTHNPKPGVLGRAAGWLARVPLVVNTQHGLYAQPTDRWQRRVPVYVAERLAAACSDVELVQNEEDVRTLVDTLHVPARKVRLLRNGIDLAHFRPQSVSAAERAAVRREWGFADDAVVCGVVGRLVREKGIVELLDAARSLHREHPDVRWVVVGPRDHDKADALDAAAIRRAEDDGVVFAGARTDMPQCYAAMDLFVTASWREGFPRAAMEASAMGLPIVATDIRGNRQVVQAGETGVLVPVRSAAALQRACGELVADADRRRSMGAAAAARAVDLFDDRQVIARTLEAYGLLQRR